MVWMRSPYYRSGLLPKLTRTSVSKETFKYKYKYNSYFYCAPYSLIDDALQKSANTCFTAVGRLK